MKEFVDATARTYPRDSHNDDYQRTAVIIDPGSGTSLDLVLPDGTFFCRVNLFARESGEWGNVDVIVDPEKITPQATAWRSGQRILTESLPGAKVVAVSLRRNPVG